MHGAMKQVTLLCIGAGGRGTMYCTFALNHPDRLQVVGVAEPREFFRQRLVTDHKIAPQHVFNDWREAARRPKLADAVLIGDPLGGQAWLTRAEFLSQWRHGAIIITKP